MNHCGVRMAELFHETRAQGYCTRVDGNVRTMWRAGARMFHRTAGDALAKIKALIPSGDGTYIINPQADPDLVAALEVALSQHPTVRRRMTTASADAVIAAAQRWAELRKTADPRGGSVIGAEERLMRAVEDLSK